MGPTWGPSGADRTLVGPMLAPWTLLSGKVQIIIVDNDDKACRVNICFAEIHRDSSNIVSVIKGTFIQHS